jgi:hypothetical protein
MTVAKKLSSEGCRCTQTRNCGFDSITEELLLKPVGVQFLGLIDPVTRGIPLGGYTTQISANVKNVFWAVADRWSIFTIGQVLPPPGLQIVTHYDTTHPLSGFMTTLPIGADIKAAAEAPGVKFQTQ